MEDATPKKDFFISYVEDDRSWAEWIGSQLEEAGYSCVVKIWDFRPGTNSVLELQRALEQANRVVAVLSPDYLSTAGVQAEWAAAWKQDPTGEQKMLVPVQVRECQQEGLLGNIIIIDLVDLNKNEAHEELLNGIKMDRSKPLVSAFPGKPFPGNASRSVLIVTLGENPMVVSEVYYLLKERKGFKFDRVVVLRPSGKKVKSAYEVLQTMFKGECELELYPLPFEDADSWLNACLFLQSFYKVLEACQRAGDTVYLSLSAGRKSMSALVAWAVPFFPCAKYLYHVVDLDEKDRKPVDPDRIKHNTSPEYIRKILCPDLGRFILVDIPFVKDQHISESVRENILSKTEEQLDRMQHDESDRVAFLQAIAAQGEKILDVCVTKRVEEQFLSLREREQDLPIAHAVSNALLRLCSTAIERMLDGSVRYKKKPHLDLYEYNFNHPIATLHSVFYYEHIHHQELPEGKAGRVVVCAIDIEEAGKRKEIKEIIKSEQFSIDAATSIEHLPPVPSPAESVLIVPLGLHPMVATQLYALLTRLQRRTIREIVLVYPGLSAEVDNGAIMIERQFLEKIPGTKCTLVPIENLEDISHYDHCVEYQTKLEEVIESSCCKYSSDCKIDLALTGGRKSMAAMTIFAAQNKKIPYVYHTVITDKDLDKDLDQMASVDRLNRLNPDVRHKFLFLCDYKNLQEKFTLFKVPVFGVEEI